MTAMAEFAALAKRDIPDVLRQQAGLVAIRAAMIQPPTANPMGGFSHPGGWAAQLKKGKERLQSQNFGEKGMFVEARNIQSKMKSAVKAAIGTDHKMVFVRKDGTKWIVPERNLVVAPNNAALSKFRRPFWKGGKVDARHVQSAVAMGDGYFRFSKMVVSTAAKNAWLRHQWAKLGRAKAGWIRAAQACGVINKLPAWVRRHSGSAGAARHYGSGDKQGWEIANLVAHANAMRLSTRVMQHALNYQAGQMMKQFKTLLEKGAGRFNR